MEEPLPYPCMPQSTFNSVPKWTQLETVKSGNFSIYMHTCIWHTLFTVDHPNIPYSAKIWRVIYLAKCPNLAFSEFLISGLLCLYITNMMSKVFVNTGQLGNCLSNVSVAYSYHNQGIMTRKHSCIYKDDDDSK